MVTASQVPPLRIFLVTLLGVVVCTSASRNLYSQIFQRPARIGSEEVVGNGCDESKPWPCKRGGLCLSFDYICDGEKDCVDGFDEDPQLCTAKDRPPVDILEQFISEYQHWLVPNILGNGSPKALAVKLIENPTIEDYRKSARLDDDQFRRFKLMLRAVQNGRQIDLILMGMPSEAWNDLYVLFGRIIKSGFFSEE